MRLIEQRETVIAPGAIVRLTREAASSLKDRVARWRVLGLAEDLVRVEDTEDFEDVRTFDIGDLHLVSGGEERITSLIPDSSSDESLVYPEHDNWPLCLRQDSLLFDDPSFFPEDGLLFDSLDEGYEDEEDDE